MGELEALRFDSRLCKTELNKFQKLLSKKDTLAEANDILPFFKRNKYLLASIASYHPKVSRFDRTANELSLFGNFVSDAVVGDSKNKAYCFIEFEGANKTSIFNQKKRLKPVWGTKLTEGLMQLADWFWTLDKYTESSDFEDKFGCRNIHYIGLLIIGRDKFIQPTEEKRWFWFQDSLQINSKKIICLTYDQLLNDLQNRLNMYSSHEDTIVQVDPTGSPSTSTKV